MWFGKCSVKSDSFSLWYDDSKSRDGYSFDAAWPYSAAAYLACCQDIFVFGLLISAMSISSASDSSLFESKSFGKEKLEKIKEESIKSWLSFSALTWETKNWKNL